MLQEKVCRSVWPESQQIWIRADLKCFPIKEETEEEQMHPFLWRFWTKTPEKGRFAIFDGSWCRKVLIERFDGKVKGFEAAEAYGAIRAFEKQLTDDKMVLIKLFTRRSISRNRKNG